MSKIMTEHGVDQITLARPLTIAAVADYFGVTTKTVRSWIRSGRPVAHRFGRICRIVPADLESFIRQQREAKVIK